MVPRSIRARVRHEHGHWGIVVVVNGPGSTFHLPCFPALTAFTASLPPSHQSKPPHSCQSLDGARTRVSRLQTTDSSEQCPVCHPWILAAGLWL
ncbi:GM14180 [Drosophila sechellia]|uniref:GM14180 n=1 Tax=Drosophila sechellia TaxID=7238 RepID=B4HVY6_DROSE|nr:GM14180 [Drosophila sechellia]